MGFVPPLNIKIKGCVPKDDFQSDTQPINSFIDTAGNQHKRNLNCSLIL
jgi:hypothetical protein